MVEIKEMLKCGKKTHSVNISKNCLLNNAQIHTQVTWLIICKSGFVFTVSIVCFQLS